MTRLLAAALLLLFATPLAAAPATAEGAAAIEAALRTYLGQTQGVVTVVPEGEAYALTLDPAPWFALLGAGGTAGPFHFSLADNGDGTWKVTEDEAVTIRFATPGKVSLESSIARQVVDCTFDVALKTCREAQGTVSGVTWHQSQTGPDGTVSEVTYAASGGEFTMTGAAAPAGDGVDIAERYTLHDLTETIRVTPGKDATGAMPFSADITMASYSADLTASAMRNEGLLALLGWFVAHPSEAAVKDDPEGLKAAIRAALPLWSSVSGQLDLSALAVTTPYGAGSAESLRFAIDASGVVPDGHVRESLSVKGLKLPVDLMPEWVPPLVPSEATIDVAATGFDLAAPAALFLDAVKPGFAPDAAFDAKLLAAFLPEGRVTVTLAPQGVVTPTYTLDLEGGFDAGPGRMPEGKVTVGATGIDAALEALGKAPEDVRSGAVPGVMMLRGMARPAGPGRFVWEVEMTPEGKVLVNGMDMSALGGMQ